MKKFLLAACLLLVMPAFLSAQVKRAPAYPLVTHDPYFCIWSYTDNLNESETRHWSNAEQSLTGFVKVDGQVYRFLGDQSRVLKTVLPTADVEKYTCQYTETAPADGWMNPKFDDSQWKTGTPPFSDGKGKFNTPWRSDNIWMRRTFTLKNTDINKLFLKINHDDNIEVYLNGTKVYSLEGWYDKYTYVPLNDDAKKLLKKGENVLAIHCANTAGGRFLDAGLSDEPRSSKNNVVAATQTDVSVNATQTKYAFTCGGVDLSLTFTSPLLMDNLALISRPVTYLSYAVKSNDGKVHNVQFAFGASTNIAVHVPEQEVVAEQYSSGDLDLLKAGTTEQPMLQKKGDFVRIDWGYMYVATPKSAKAVQTISESDITPLLVKGKQTNKLTGHQLTLNTVFPAQKVGGDAVDGYLMLAYDDLYSVQYFGTDLKAWWKKDGATIEEEITRAVADYNDVMKRCESFDKGMYASALRAGGDEYAKLCAISYRQSIAAHKLVQSPQGDILFLSKENCSNGSINTVDITYPSSPLYLYYNPDLLEGMLNGIYYYSESGKWPKPYPSHDIGTYPIGNGQTYGEDMPVEEAGNMIILTAAITKVRDNADYAKRRWKTLTTWTNYLVENGLDPGNQLCTDDFAGHLAHNANLSVKAIVAIASYAYMADQIGEKETARRYRNIANEMVGKWMEMSADGDHYSLTFDKKGTWSQKYNLVWDKVLGFNLFPKEVYEKEVKYYLTQQRRYGLPLDSRRTYTKADWILWTACMTDNTTDFKTLVHPVYLYISETPSRVPFSDWYDTPNAVRQNFQARSVVGGIFMHMLEKDINNPLRDQY